MKKNPGIDGIIIVLLLLFLLQCSGGGDEVITGVTPGSAVGYLYHPDGKPADSVHVNAVLVDNFPYSAPTIYFSRTNPEGRYEFPSVRSGTYNFFCKSDSLRAMVELVQIQGTIVLPDDTLKVPGRIDGVVRLSGGEDCRTVLIMVRGGEANLVTGPLDTTGVFSFDTLAEGNYQIRFLSTYRSYPVLDTSFSVLSGKSTDIGTIIMRWNP